MYAKGEGFRFNGAAELLQRRDPVPREPRGEGEASTEPLNCFSGENHDECDCACDTVVLQRSR